MSLGTCKFVVVISVCLLRLVYGETCYKCAGYDECERLATSNASMVMNRDTVKVADIAAPLPEVNELYKLLNAESDFEDPEKLTNCFAVKFFTNDGIMSELRAFGPEKIGKASFCDYVTTQYEKSRPSKGLIDSCISCKGTNCNVLQDAAAASAAAPAAGAASAAAGGGGAATTPAGGTTTANNTATTPEAYMKNVLYSTITSVAVFNLLH